jgi:hypothetical protein
MMNGEQRRRYVREVVRAMVGLEPEDYRMSVAEFGVLQNWMDKGVPLRVVLQAMTEMDKHPSILYIKPAVEKELERIGRALA